MGIAGRTRQPGKWQPRKSSEGAVNGRYIFFVTR